MNEEKMKESEELTIKHKAEIDNIRKEKYFAVKTKQHVDNSPNKNNSNLFKDDNQDKLSIENEDINWNYTKLNEQQNQLLLEQKNSIKEVENKEFLLNKNIQELKEENSRLNDDHYKLNVEKGDINSKYTKINEQ